jgi:hypothetical protein
MDRGALDHALERGRRHRFGAFDIGDEVRQILVDEGDSVVRSSSVSTLQAFITFGGVRLVDQRQQQMLQRREFVARALASASAA